MADVSDTPGVPHTMDTPDTTDVPDTPAIPDAAPESTSTTPAAPIMSFPRSLRVEAALTELRPLAKYKARSHETSKNTHVPLLQSCLGPDARPGPSVVFIGDSMIERMLTTGGSPNFPEPWPSPFLMDDAALAEANGTTHRFDRAFNAGVGGDKIENLIYRLVGSEGNDDEEKNLPGLLPLLAEIGTVKVWVVNVGTNNLSPKKGMPFEFNLAMQTLIGALLSIRRKDGGPSYVLVSYLFPRLDVPLRFVRQANKTIKSCSKANQSRYGVGIPDYMEIPLALEKREWHKDEAEFKEDLAKYLDDHVHLNLDGYRVWIDRLYGHIDRYVRHQS